jgi:rare lipoprotein A
MRRRAPEPGLGRLRWAAALLIAIGGIAACAAVRHDVRPEAQQAGPPASPAAFQVGLASWYGEFHHGRPTASGETFDLSQLTAAHRTLPLGTQLRVTNLENGRVVRVRVNDRGPYVTGRVLDLSHEAARRLDMIERGVAPVRLDIVEP